jgi:hypothetical protein
MTISTAPHPALQDADFCLAYCGEGAEARIVHGWDALVNTVQEDAGHPDAQHWSVTLGDLTEWDYDESCPALPYRFTSQLEITTIQVFRLSTCGVGGRDSDTPAPSHADGPSAPKTGES